MNIIDRFLAKFHHEESAISQEVKDALLHMEDEITASEARMREEIGEWKAASSTQNIPIAPEPAAPPETPPPAPEAPAAA